METGKGQSGNIAKNDGRESMGRVNEVGGMYEDWDSKMQDINGRV